MSGPTARPGHAPPTGPSRDGAADGAADSAGGGSVATGSLLVAFAACCFGAISTLVVVATRPDGAQPGLALPAALFWRYLIAALVLAPLAWRDRGTSASPPPAGRWGWLGTLAVAGGGQAAIAGLSLSALRWIPVGTLAFLFYTFPAWVTLLSAVRGTERPNARRLVAVGLSFAGIVATVGLPGGDGPAAATPWPGILLALAGALVYALYIPFLGALTGRTSPARASATVAAGAALCFGAWAGPALLVPPTLAQGLALAALSLVCTVIAFLAFMRGLARLGPVRTAIVSTVEPLFTAVLGAVALAQPITPGLLVGGALIAAAVVLLQLPARRAAAPTG